jgi:hypothetical protein
MPATEDSPHFIEHVLGEYVGIRAGATILERFELSDDVSPAKLPDSFLLVRTVGRIVSGDLKMFQNRRTEHAGNPPSVFFRKHPHNIFFPFSSSFPFSFLAFLC